MSADYSVMEKLISLENCSLEYNGTKVLSDVNLTICHGEKIAFIGKSGSGKSTLLKHLRAQLSNQVAWCPQQLGLVPMLSVYHNIYMGGLDRFNTLSNLSNLVIPNAGAKVDVTKVAESLGLKENLWTSVDQLSGGQQQRTAIGRALFQKKPTLLADEPVSALDSFQSQQILSALTERHNTVILALHDVDLAQQFCDRIVGLKDGQVVFDCNVDQLDSQRLSKLYNH